jgi:hypothetical protein
MTRFNKIAYLECVRGAKIPAGAVQVLVVLYTYSDATGGNIHPGIKRLAGDCRMGESTVSAQLKLLTDRGFIREECRGGRSWDGRKWASVYQLCIPGSPSDNLEVDGVSNVRKSRDGRGTGVRWPGL